MAYVFEGDIKKYALHEINKNLKTKVKIDEKNISFSLFKKFPKASLTFTDFLINEENKKGTLLFSESLSLEFGLGSIFSGNYSVKEIEKENAVVNLRVNKAGKENFNILKENTDSNVVNDKFQFRLEEVNFRNVTLNYLAERNKSNLNLILKKTKFNDNNSD